MRFRKIHINFFLVLAWLLMATHSFAQSDSSSRDWIVKNGKESIAKKPDSSDHPDTVYLVVKDTVFAEPTDTTSFASDIGGEGAEGIKSISQIFSIGKIFWAIIFLIFSYFMIRLTVFIVESFAERSTKYRFILKSITPFVKILGWFLAIFVVVEGIFQPPKSTILAFLASFGIAVGFAAQDILKNIFGGIMILFDRPFQVGDKIQVGEHYGEVKEIGLRSTRIVTKDDSLISVPNAEVVNTAVSNSNSGEANCQVVAEIYLPIDVDTNRARQLAMEAARVSRYVYLNKPISVLFINEVKQRRSFLKMRLKAYVSDIRYEFSFQSDMTEIVMDEMLKEGLIKKEDLS